MPNYCNEHHRKSFGSVSLLDIISYKVIVSPRQINKSAVRKANRASLLTRVMNQSKQIKERKYRQARLLPHVSENNPDYQKLRVYFFGTPNSTVLSISRRYGVEDLINHIIALSSVDPQVRKYFMQDLPQRILGNYRDSELYEMRVLINEDDPTTPYIPCFKSRPLIKANAIGSYLVSGVSFCRTKEFQEILEKHLKGNS